jgi:hypothetical protein
MGLCGLERGGMRLNVIKTAGRRAKWLVLLAAAALPGLFSAGCSSAYVIRTCMSAESSSDLGVEMSERGTPDRINITVDCGVVDSRKMDKPGCLRQETFIRHFFDRKSLFSEITFQETVKDRDNLTVRMRMTRDTSESGVGEAFLFGVTLGLAGLKTTQEYEFQASFQPFDGDDFEKTYRLAVHNVVAPKKPPSNCEVIATADAKLNQGINRDLVDWRLTEKFLTLLIADLQSEGYLQ